MQMVAYLGLGSNLGDRQFEIERAVAALGQRGRVLAVSGLYETLPEGGAVQPNYLNAAVRIDTPLSAREILVACLDIEQAQGRVRPAGGGKASRTIDIDVLLYDSQVINEPDLCVPHPRLMGRPFVRIPLADVAQPGLRHPVTGEPLDRCGLDSTVAPVPSGRAY